MTTLPGRLDRREQRGQRGGIGGEFLRNAS